MATFPQARPASLLAGSSAPRFPTVRLEIRRRFGIARVGSPAALLETVEAVSTAMDACPVRELRS